jgi:hypothetical protein
MNIEHSLFNLRRLLPLKVYATLDSYIAEATVADFITLSGDVFKLGLLIVWNGQEYRNPCKAGLAMTQSLRAHYGIADTKSTTFDGWHRLRVILQNGMVLRLDELLTPDIRRSSVVFTEPPAITDVASQSSLLELMGRQNILRIGEDNVSVLPRVSEPLSRAYLALKPYLTILSEFCGTSNVPDIVRMVKTIPEDTVCDILDANARRMLAILHQDN